MEPRHSAQDTPILAGMVCCTRYRVCEERLVCSWVVIDRQSLTPSLTVIRRVNFVDEVLKRQRVAIADALAEHADVTITKASQKADPVEL